MLGRSPVPHRVDDVALDALRPLRLVERQFARRDPVGPVGEQRIDLFRSHAAERQRHVLHGLAGLGAQRPCGVRVVAFHEQFRHFADAARAQCMAGLAHVLDRIHPLRLGLHGLRHLVAVVAGAWKFARRRNFQQRVPVHAWIQLRRGRRRGGRGSLEVELPARAGVEPRRVLQAVTANPDLVRGIRQFGDHEAALVIGHHDLGISGRQIPGLGNHPHAGFGTFITRHLPPDVVRRQLDGGGAAGARVQHGDGPKNCRKTGGGEQLQIHVLPFLHPAWLVPSCTALSSFEPPPFPARTAHSCQAI